MNMENPPQCKALNVSDETRCLEPATSTNGHFCSFHAKQCQGLYRGYKLRNARLDRLAAKLPKFLADSEKSGIALQSMKFDTIETKEECKEVHDHLFLTLQLLERVIRARRLHHSRFFAEDCDYGHAKFLEGLQNQKGNVTRALERLERRTAEVLWKEKNWFSWVRSCQDEEERGREKEKEKVKMEGAMFRRNWKAARLRARDLKAKEEKLRQDAYLEKVYKESLTAKEKSGDYETDDDQMDWDPIEDVLEDNRGSYLDLIQSFLWMDAPNSSPELDVSMNDVVTTSSFVPEPAALAELPDAAQSPSSAISTVVAKPSHSSKKSKAKAKNKKKNNTAPKPQNPIPEPEKGLIETRDEMYERLKNGSDLVRRNVTGVMIAGTMENPLISTKTVAYPEDQTQKLLTEVHNIKHLLFCRLLLGHATLLPAALNADSVEDFLADPEVSTAALRDLCLKMENPGLQEIRDACADLFRSEEEEEEADIEMTEPDQGAKSGSGDYDKDGMPMWKPLKKRGELPDCWKPKSETAKMVEAMGAMPTLNNVLGPGQGGTVDFGEIKEEDPPKRKIRIKICGRSIWNYPSDKAMNRGGWLHFCIIAKDSSLNEAVALCRHWDEFFELNILAIWQYFPGANWAEWVGSRYRQQMLSLGFIMFFESTSPDAAELTTRENTRNRGSRRSHAIFEARNFICAHIKRNDPVSRRLIQYLSMQSSKVVVLVRDAETGKLLIKPPEEERWLFRQKLGVGRASKNDWNVVKSIGPQFFEEIDKWREWKFSFKEYYDVYVWDLEAGEPFPALYNCVQEMLFKAHRFREGRDTYNPAEHVLKTICRDPETHRHRDIKPGEEIESTWDCIHHEETKFLYTKLPDPNDVNGRRPFEDVPDMSTRNLFYNKADELEDVILFPGELADNQLHPLAVGKTNPLDEWMEEGFSMKDFVEGNVWWESSDDEDSEQDSQDCEEDDDKDDEGSEWASIDGIEDSNNTTNATANEVADPGSNNLDLVRGVSECLGYSDELSQIMKKLALKPILPPKDRGSRDVIQEEFMTFLDKEKAKIFKKVWHNADLEPNAQAHYVEMMSLYKKSRKYLHKTPDCAPNILAFNLIYDVCSLRAGKDDSRDVHRAVAKVMPFFHVTFLESAEGKDFEESLIFDQAERAKQFPDARSHVSNKYRDPNFFKELDDKITAADGDATELPLEWDVCTRPAIAHLYKCGVLRSRSDPYHEGQAFVNTEHGREKADLFFDWRSNIEAITIPPGMVDPHTIAPFKTTAAAFTSKHPSARFAVLSIWSAPHFYPLMIGWDKHDATSFRDLVNRNFDWMFVPKDMPFSEFSIHHTARMRLEPYNKYLGNSVVLKRDKFLVMGKDEKECFKLAAATTFAVQKNPWRLEIDLWKSFVNVDIGFLEGLDERWLN